MTKKQVTQNVSRLITENKIKEALDLLAAYVKGLDKHLENDIRLQTTSFSKSLNDYNNDLISWEDHNMAIANATYFITQILERLPENGMLSGESVSDTSGDDVNETRNIDDDDSGDGLESTSKKDIVQDKDKFINYKVLYGTNRATSNDENGQTAYGNKRGNNLCLGLCEVSIPHSHKIGSIERPSWFGKMFFKESPEKHFTILSNEKMAEDKFKDLLRQKVEKSTDKDVLLFIHGFNVEFNEAMMRAAQLGFDLNFKGAVTAYSWPSLGTVSGYVADTDSARLSAGYLSTFIKTLINDSGVNNLYIIAHSMGNVVLTNSLMQLKNEGVYPSSLFNQIILAAPDIDKDIFIQEIMPAIKGDSRLTLYASDKDKALIFSKTIRKGYIRLGEAGNNIVITDGLDSVDASRVDTSLLGHGYFSDTQSLINDIHMVLLGLPPNKRILDSQKKVIDGISKLYWTLRET